MLLFFVVAIAGCIGSENEPKAVEEKKADAAVPAATTTEPVVAKVSKPDHDSTVKCELCHKDAKELKPHLNGGKLCINCHGSQVHTIHIGPATVNLGCELCHGNPPKVPKVEKGEGPGYYSICEKCHAEPPDSLSPSNGDLIDIHLSRAKYCTNCHGTDIGATHAAAFARAAGK